MKILKVLRRNSNKAIAILLCFTLIFSNSLVTLAETNFDDPNTETSESIVEDIEENVEDEQEEESQESDSEEIDDDVIEETEVEEDADDDLQYEEEPEEDMEEEPFEELSEEDDQELESDESNGNNIEEITTEDVEEEIEENIEEEIEENIEEEIEDIDVATMSEIEEIDDLDLNLFNQPLMALPMFGDAPASAYIDKDWYNNVTIAKYEVTSLSILCGGTEPAHDTVFEIPSPNGTNSLKCYANGTDLILWTPDSEIKAGEDCYGLFTSFDIITELNNLQKIDFSNTTIMECMLSGCYSISSLDLSNLKTQNVENMISMFDGNSATTINLSNFNTSNVKYMNDMFANCDGLPTLNLSSFNTSKVEDMSQMFMSCISLENVNLSSFNTEKVETMERMFSFCESLTSLDLSTFKLSNLNNLASMFIMCSSLTTIYANENFYKDGLEGSNMFNLCYNLVGGKGTVYDDSTVEAVSFLYARVDNPPSAPGYFTYKAPPTPPTPPAPPTPPHGGGGSSSGGGGGGSAGRPVYDNQGNILHPGTEPNIKGTTKVLTGQKQIITISSNNQMVDWNRSLRASEPKPIIFVNETKKFLDTDTFRTITNDWVGVVNQNGNINWYFTNNDGSLIQSQLFQVGDGVFCFGEDGIMLTGNVQIGNEIYYFNESKGAGEGAFVRKEPISL